MNKAELILEVQKTLGKDEYSKALTERILNGVIASIKKGIKKDGTVQLIGFGTFATVERKARKGINPRTGEALKIKASKSVRFKPGKALKDSLK